MEAIAGENLKDLFEEKWQELFSSLSDALGFRLSIYAEGGASFAVPRDISPFCKIYQSVSPEFTAHCRNFCLSRISRAIASGKPEVFKCAARIVNFTLPIEYLGERAAVLGQGSFENYSDLREFMNCTNSSDPEALSIAAPLVFTGREQAQKAQALVADSVRRFLENSRETVALRRKFESLKSVFSSWVDVGGRSPDTLYRDLLDKLSTLFEVDSLAVLIRDRDNRYGVRYQIGSRDEQGEPIDDQHPVISMLAGGKPFVLVTDQQEGLGADDHALYFFPIITQKQLPVLLRIGTRRLTKNDAEIIAAFCRQAGLSMENQALRSDLVRKFDRYAAMSELTAAMYSKHDDKALLKVVLDKSAELLAAEQGSLMVLDHETDVLLVEARKGVMAGATDQLRITRGEGIAGRVVERGEPILVEDLESDPRFKQKNRKHYKTPSFMSVPIKTDARVIGVLNLADKDGGEAFNEEDLKLIQSIASQLAVVMERNLFYSRTEELKKLSITDDLTGLVNRRHLDERLKDEVARSDRHGHELSIVMLDLDGFKACNDTHGHLVGDGVLKEAAETLLQTVRSIDIVARYGGDEFTVILPETGRAVAVEIAERMRRNISARVFQAGSGPDVPGVRLTVSIGIACYPEHGKSVDLLLQHADRALYEAKNKGKNSIEVSA